MIHKLSNNSTPPIITAGDLMSDVTISRGFLHHDEFPRKAGHMIEYPSYLIVSPNRTDPDHEGFCPLKPDTIPCRILRYMAAASHEGNYLTFSLTGEE